MEKKHYLIEVDEGIEPYVHGPFKTDDECDEEAKRMRRTQGMDDCLFWADVDEGGVLTVGSYMARFFLEEPTDSDS
ncbi:MAG: hypothetical protein HYY46_01760 [Deltaproteobacteria bacterium]|nr:hypothetical protein [Deltaproteobacteria bacterium]